MIRLSLVVSGMLLANAAAAWADCYGVSVKGCNKEEKVCVDNSTPQDAPAIAKEAFKDKNACNTASAGTSIESCGDIKCDVRVGN